ncbi:hypothetical protein M2092_000246 [Fusobacterium sp. PH5-44]
MKYKRNLAATCGSASSGRVLHLRDLITRFKLCPSSC